MTCCEKEGHVRDPESDFCIHCGTNLRPWDLELSWGEKIAMWLTIGVILVVAVVSGAKLFTP
jgi:hypothetical protein